MTEENYLSIKEDYISHIKDYVNETGGLFPHITIFAEIREPKDELETKPALIHIPIPDQFMSDDEKKEEFVTDVLPGIIKEVRKKFIPKGVAWAAEAWLRMADKKDDVSDYKKLPIKKEVIIITIESESKNDSYIYEIVRTGKQVNSEGELVDAVKLEEMESFKNPDQMGGRFSGLFKKFNNG